MVKQLLSFAAALAVAAGAQAAVTTVLWEAKDGKGSLVNWGSQPEGCVFDASVCTSFAAGDKIVVTAGSKTTDVEWPQVGIKGGNWATLGSTVGLWGDVTFPLECEFVLTEEFVTIMKEKGFWPTGEGAYVTKVVHIGDAGVDLNLLWEGTYTISNWNYGAKFAASMVKPGDILTYTFTEAGKESSQVIVKGNDWQSLLGTSKMGHNDFSRGTVTVGVTEAMIEAAGGSIFLQGEGECVTTKVVRVPEQFDAKGYVSYGERSLGSSTYCILPDDAKTIAIVLTGTPQWVQFCAANWTDLGLESTVTNNADGTVTYTYTLTPDAIKTINESKEFIVNGGGVNFLCAYLPDRVSSLPTVEIADDSNAPVEYFNLQGVRVNDPASGLYIRRQGNSVSKVVIR